MDEYILTEVERTKRRGSASERVNELLKRTLDLEQQERLQREAAVFYSEVKDRQEVLAFQNTSRRALAKDNRPHGL